MKLLMYQVKMEKETSTNKKKRNYSKRSKSFIENNATEKLLNFLASENERSRRHEAEMMQMMLQINNPVHYNQANFPKYLEIRITKIGRAVYLTQIRILSNLNHQYHNQINQRPVAQRIVNMSMLILRIQHLLLMTPPGLHTSHLISNY